MWRKIGRSSVTHLNKLNPTGGSLRGQRFGSDGGADAVRCLSAPKTLSDAVNSRTGWFSTHTALSRSPPAFRLQLDSVCQCWRLFKDVQVDAILPHRVWGRVLFVCLFSFKIHNFTSASHFFFSGNFLSLLAQNTNIVFRFLHCWKYFQAIRVCTFYSSTI